MKYDIDVLYEALLWGNEAPRAEAVEAAMAIRNLHVFLQPILNPPEKSKAVWEGCAMVLARHSDEALAPHLSRLLEWLQDLNWPGAEIIYDRLLTMDETYLRWGLDSIIRTAQKLDDDPWLYWLTEFQQEYDALHAQ